LLQARARNTDSLTGWILCARPLARQMQLLRKYTLLHAGAATSRYTPEKLLLSSLLAGAINNFFMVYPQKYKNCSTLFSQSFSNKTIFYLFVEIYNNCNSQFEKTQFSLLAAAVNSEL
jgi:hypothetical protein